MLPPCKPEGLLVGFEWFNQYFVCFLLGNQIQYFGKWNKNSICDGNNLNQSIKFILKSRTQCTWAFMLFCQKMHYITTSDTKWVFLCISDVFVSSHEIFEKSHEIFDWWTIL